jgi:protoporphyrinogen oxidase
MQIPKKQKILIIGAGPAGLSAAHKLSQQKDTEIIIWEKNSQVGGLARTLSHQGFLFDLGPHRFFTKNDEINEFWENILPLQGKSSAEDLKWKKNNQLSDRPDAPDPEKDNRVMLSKNRLTRMFFKQKFFDYPLKLNAENLLKLGPINCLFIGLSYLQIKLFPRQPEINLEDFYINRFGKKLYQFFFKDYTEKVWGVPCKNIPKEWGAQRVKDLSLTKMISNFIKSALGLKNNNQQTSLIDKFTYPKYGAGHFYQTLADSLLQAGVKIELNTELKELKHENGLIKSVSGEKTNGQKIILEEISNVISTMPIKELVTSLSPQSPKEISIITEALPYRNSIIVAILYKKLSINNETKILTRANIIPDHWIYIHESGVDMVRISLFNNFSEFMLGDKNLPWMSLEYCCNESDAIWKQTDALIIEKAKIELEKMGLANYNDFITAKVEKIEKSYPAYFGSYAEFPKIKEYLDKFTNLFPTGRNGQHKYNNMDHSIACGFEAANLIIQNKKDKNFLWSINTDTEYQEKK